MVRSSHNKRTARYRLRTTHVLRTTSMQSVSISTPSAWESLSANLQYCSGTTGTAWPSLMNRVSAHFPTSVCDGRHTSFALPRNAFPRFDCDILKFQKQYCWTVWLDLWLPNLLCRRERFTYNGQLPYRPAVRPYGIGTPCPLFLTPSTPRRM